MDIEQRFRFTARHGQLVTLQDGNEVATANHHWCVHPRMSENAPVVVGTRPLRCDICNARLRKRINRWGYATKVIDPNEEYLSDYNNYEQENEYQICENCAAIIEDYYNPGEDIKEPEFD